jgi:hypothetical protein
MSRMHPPQAQRGINIFKKLSRREAIHPQSKQAGARLFDDEPKLKLEMVTREHGYSTTNRS